MEEQDGSSTTKNDVERQLVQGVLREMLAIKPSLRFNEFKTLEQRQSYARNLLAAFVESNINSDDHIKRGLAKMRKDSGNFAPSIGKFIEWCSKPDSDPIHKTYLPPPSETPEQRAKRISVGKENIKKLLKKMKGA